MFKGELSLRIMDTHIPRTAWLDLGGASYKRVFRKRFQFYWVNLKVASAFSISVLMGSNLK